MPIEDEEDGRREVVQEVKRGGDTQRYIHT